MLRHLLRSLTAEARPANSATDAGLAQLDAGDLEGAESAARAALVADAGAAIPHLVLGRIALARGEEAAARAALERALAIDPALDAARATLAGVAQSAGRHDEAVAHYRAALVRHPDSPKLFHALGTALAASGAFDEAAVALARALELAPDLAPAREALSRTLFNARRFAEAEAVERASLAREPDAMRLHLRLAHALLAQGKFADGWDEYEWRLQRPGFAPPRGLPLWDGSEPLGRTILVLCEQGLGDAILFARFVPELAQRGARVRLLCRPALERLLQTSLAAWSVAVTTDATAAAAGADFCIHLLSLPHALGPSAGAVARCTRYLRVDHSLTAAWRQRLAGLTHPRIGLAWAGNPERAADDSRSLPPSTLAPLGAARPDAVWANLQAGLAAEVPRPFAMADWMGSVADFADTAALIAELDLVISVDTSVAHAAAAVGTPLWLLAPHNVCWRWVIGDQQSPWYPGVRLFQARRPGEWEPVIDAVAKALDTLGAESAR